MYKMSTSVRFLPSQYSGNMFSDLELLDNSSKMFFTFGAFGAVAGAAAGLFVGSVLPKAPKTMCVIAGSLAGAGAGLYLVRSDDRRPA